MTRLGIHSNCVLNSGICGVVARTCAIERRIMFVGVRGSVDPAAVAGTDLASQRVQTPLSREGDRSSRWNDEPRLKPDVSVRSAPMSELASGFATCGSLVMSLTLAAQFLLRHAGDVESSVSAKLVVVWMHRIRILIAPSA